MLIPVILSGGVGTRLWPLSRELYPKQFLPLVGERTMIQETALRVGAIPGATAPIVVCNEAHRFLVAEQFRQVGIGTLAILLEPAGRRNLRPLVPQLSHGFIKQLKLQRLLHHRHRAGR